MDPQGDDHEQVAKGSGSRTNSHHWEDVKKEGGEDAPVTIGTRSKTIPRISSTTPLMKRAAGMRAQPGEGSDLPREGGAEEEDLSIR